MMMSRLHCHRFMTFPSAMLLTVRNACTKLFIGGLSFDTNETVLRDAFIQHGEIIEVRVICHHVSGKSKGYGFVKFASEDAAASALNKMNGFRWEEYPCLCGKSTMTGVSLVASKSLLTLQMLLMFPSPFC